jgi:hypothetical protein
VLAPAAREVFPLAITCRPSAVAELGFLGEADDRAPKAAMGACLARNSGRYCRRAGAFREFTEPAIYYQASYVRLLSKFVK